MSWRPWLADRAQEIPCFTYLKNLSPDECRGALKELCGIWAKKTRPPLPLFNEFVSRTRWVVFQRLAKSFGDAVKPSAVFAMCDRDRAEAHKVFGSEKTPIYCVGCADKVTVSSSGSGQTVQTTVSFLGYVGEIDHSLKYGVKMFQPAKIHGISVRGPYVAVCLEYLKFDFGAFEAPSPLPLGELEDSGGEEEGERGEESPNSRVEREEGGRGEERERRSKFTEPSNHVYVFGLDFIGDADKKALLETDVESMALSRLKVLCDMSKGELPPKFATMRTKEGAERDRFIMHFLVHLMCWSEELVHWYVSAETSLLQHKMDRLCEPADVIYTIRRAHIDPLNEREIDFWKNATELVCETQERRLYLAMDCSKKAGTLPDLIKPSEKKARRMVTGALKTFI